VGRSGGHAALCVRLARQVPTWEAIVLILLGVVAGFATVLIIANPVNASMLVAAAVALGHHDLRAGQERGCRGGLRAGWQHHRVAAKRCDTPRDGASLAAHGRHVGTRVRLLRWAIPLARCCSPGVGEARDGRCGEDRSRR